MSVTRRNDGRASSITKAHQAAVNAQIITEANPWMANDPETLMRLATSGADPVSLATNAGAMAGMEGIEKLGAAMEGMTEVGKRAAYGRLTEQQQRARRTGGMRSLLSPEREDARRGLSTTLGGRTGE